MPVESALRDRNGAGYELIETLRWQSDGGFVRLDRHMARLIASARALGFTADPERIAQAMSSALSGEATQRVRLTLAKDGEATAISTPFTVQPDDTVWTLRVADTRLASSDRLLRHKTSRRAAYDAARAEFTRDQADEVLLRNEDGEMCDGTITSLFVDIGNGGKLRTPPLGCGLLAGVLRAEMLDSGKAIESVLSVEDLLAAKAIFVGNSLRGLIKAKFGWRSNM